MSVKDKNNNQLGAEKTPTKNYREFHKLPFETSKNGNQTVPFQRDHPDRWRLVETVQTLSTDPPDSGIIWRLGSRPLSLSAAYYLLPLYPTEICL